MTLWQRFLHVTHIRRQRKLRFPNGVPRVLTRDTEPTGSAGEREPRVIDDEIRWPRPYLPPINLDNIGPDPRYNGREHG